MRDHPLAPLMRPQSVAIVGATEFTPGRMGTRTMHDFVEVGWTGRLYPVTTRAETLYGHRCYARLSDLPEAPDLVIARVPAAALEAVVEEAIAIGARALIALASGFAETGDAGRDAQQAIAARAKAAGLRLLGPQSIGHINFVDGIPATLSALLELVPMEAGDIALLSQSGALSNYTTVRARARGLALSHVVTFGNAADVTPAEVIDYLAGAPETRVIACYLEGVQDGAAFRNACLKARAAGKVVIALKSGRSAAGRRAVASHTASMTGSAEAFAALCASSGVIAVDSIEALLDTAAMARLGIAPDKAGFLSFSGAACALFADYCAEAGLEIGALTPATCAKLEEVLPWFLKPAMPFDVGQIVFDPPLFARALELVAADPGLSPLIVNLHTINPAALEPLNKIAAIAEAVRATGRPLIVVWEAARPEDWAALCALDRVALFSELSNAVAALGRCAAAGAVPRPAGLRAPLAPPSGAGGVWDERRAKDWLSGQGVPVPKGVMLTAAALDDPARIAALTAPLALKIVSPDILHKTEAGGVALGLAPGAVPERAARMLAEVATKAPAARLEGVLVEEMAPPGGVEVVLGMLRDPECGPVLTAGLGGTHVELIRDVARRICPVSPDEAAEMLRELRSFPLLDGYRGAAPADLPALAALMSTLSGTFAAAPWLQQLEINPVLVHASGEGVSVVDAVIEGSAETAAAAAE